MERRRYSERPPRDEYVLTERGRDFRPVLWSLLAWGNRHFAPEGPSVVLVDAASGAVADPVLVDRVSGRPMTAPTFRSAAGPAADERTRRRHGAARRSCACLAARWRATPLPPRARIGRRGVRRARARRRGRRRRRRRRVVRPHWWTVGRFIETTDDAYVGGNITPLAPHVPGFVQQVLVTRQSARAGRATADPARPARLPRRPRPRAGEPACAGGGAGGAAGAGRAATGGGPPAAGGACRAKSAEAGFTAIDADRYRSLARSQAASRQDAQRSTARDNEAQAAVAATAAALDAARAQLQVLAARIAEAEADLAGARSDLRDRRTQSRLHRDPRADRRVCRQPGGADRRLCHRRHLPDHRDSRPRPLGRCEFQGGSARRHGRGRAGDGVRRCHAGPRAARPRGQPLARHRRGVQRDPAGERHRQLHQDRAARAGARRARRRRRRAGHAAPRPVDHRHASIRGTAAR